jgi:parallel beta-helix repeat protein
MCGRLSRVSLLVFILTSMLMLNIVQGPSLVSTDNSEMDDAPVQQTSRKIAYTPHDPIVINGDSNFSATAALEGWLGDGSAGDPYVIDSLEIDRQGAALHCINISNTRVNFTISNCNLTGASSPASGIFLDNVTNGRIEGNIVYGNHFNIYLTNAHFNVVKNNTCWGSVYSISMRVSSSNNTITDNDSSNNSDRGVNLESGSQYNVVINNTCVNNRFGVVLYLVSYNIIMNNNFSNNDDHGIHNNDADYNVMINNTCNVNDYGIYLFSSSVYNELSNNTCNDNRNIGIYLVSSGLNDLINNTCSFNSNYGMYLVGSDRCNMYNNTCNGNTLYGLYLVMTDQGVYYDNVFNSNDYGIYQISSQQNTISNNTFANNDVYGISLSGSSLNNILEWNVFVENVISCIDSSSLTNSFVYNFWSDYTGIDANQNAIGDTPYVILGSAGNQDSSPIVIHPSLDIGWTDPPSDQLYEYGEPIIYDVDASAFSGIDQWTVNDTGFNIDSFGVITNSTILPIDLYGLEVTVNDTKGNYLTETITVTVVSVFPTWIEEPTDQFVTYSKTFRYDLNATDYDGLDLWWINDTARFSIDQEGIITNVTTLALGYYALQVSVNDTKGNTLTGEFGVTVWIYNTHEPIVIVGDDDFSNIATIEGWQGAGTSLSPYVIEYMIIDRNGEVGHCISISHTRVNFIIRDSILSSASIDPGSGIYLNNVTNGELINNTCFSNFVGIYLYNSSSNSVVSNNCSSNSHAGIFLYQYGSHNILTDNTCRGNTVGIRLEDGGRDHEVLENYCNENSAYGIFLIRTSFSTVDNNTCNSNLDRGICLESNSNNTVSNNLCSSNTRFGLVLYYSHYNDVFRNNFSFNGEQGVHHRQSSYNNIFENGFNDNYHGYFLWEDSNYNFFTNNSFNYNENDGIEIQGCYYNNFTFNSFSYNSMRGNVIATYRICRYGVPAEFVIPVN